MERIRDWATGLCCGWPVDLVRKIVARHLDEVMVLNLTGVSNRPLRGKQQREPASITNRSR